MIYHKRCGSCDGCSMTRRLEICKKCKYCVSGESSMYCEKRMCTNLDLSDCSVNNKISVDQSQVTINIKKENANCTCKNAVYIVECKKCNVQYVGQTVHICRRIHRHMTDTRYLHFFVTIYNT